MRILSVTAQKPCSTGSGVYLTEVVKALAKEGHTQTVLAGIARGEQMDMPDGVKAYPVYFESEGLPYPVVGMSDEMPYISTRYKDMTEEMTVQFRNAFLAVLDEVIEREDPELILDDIESGIKGTSGAYIRIADRRAAVAYAFDHAREGDIIVLAGKGHEDYQEICGVKHPMDERVLIKEVLEELKEK